jgi:carbamoyltransferase
MDSLETIYGAHGLTFTGDADAFYTSAVENSLQFFAMENIIATYFVVASDLQSPAKRRAIETIVTAGHKIACHGSRHRFLHKLDSQEKHKEIVAAKATIEDTLGCPCQGFRAPGYSIDFESLDILANSGYRYDSSVFPNYKLRTRLGVQRLFPEPFLLFPEYSFFEVPLPYLGPLLPPFHPCYAFYLTKLYFKLGVNLFKKHHNYMTLLFHLTDFADRLKLEQNFKLNVLTNNFFSKSKKIAFLRGLIKKLRKEFSFMTTEDFLENWPSSAPDLNPKTILGISTTHETGACIVRDGKILAAINEERLSRKKLDNAYPPLQSTREVIRLSGVDPKEIDAVAISGLHWKDLIPQSLDSFWNDVKDFHAWNDYFPHLCRILYRLYYFWRTARYDRIFAFLKKEYGISPKPYYIEHHEAHAASCYRTGSGKEALVITADGVGDDISITFSEGRGSTIRRLESFFYPNSFGQFYTACTQILGFKGGRHEGKITGLSGYGKPNQRLIKAVEMTFLKQNGFKLNKRYYSEGFIRLGLSDLIDLLRGRFDILSVDYRNYKPPLKNLLDGHTREDVAYAFQYFLEREMLRLAMRFKNNGQLHLVLAGGVFANVKLNMALSQGLNPESIYIFPNMGDGGLCVGAALTVNAPTPTSVDAMYLGTKFSEEDILRALTEYSNLPYTRPNDMGRTVAMELSKKKIVARFDGRMEFGPRALGNRSILYHSGDPSVNNWLNRQLKRTEFMPLCRLLRSAFTKTLMSISLFEKVKTVHANI